MNFLVQRERAIGTDNIINCNKCIYKVQLSHILDRSIYVQNPKLFYY